ncbi:unnamed protein product [Echinostoma caproni]|uniref:Tetraspanin n=1 Tax=Echinostoma caproni TaxID=27848 RepID=A0A183A672_9TREM|nr:unnamed protein product [Echinostoma caproni]
MGGVGIYYQPRYSKVDDYRLNGLLIGFTVIGCVLFVTAVFGMISAFVTNVCILLLYVIVLILVIIAQAVCGFVATAYRSNGENHIIPSIRKYVTNYNTDPEYRQIMDNIQTDYGCCGAYGPTDYKDTRIPESCYKDGTLLQLARAPHRQVVNQGENPGPIMFESFRAALND